MATFSKRHYSHLASIMRDELRITKLTGSAIRLDQHEMMICRLAQSLQQDNSNFNVNRFLTACDLNHLAIDPSSYNEAISFSREETV
jgi:hypothetical protein